MTTLINSTRNTNFLTSIGGTPVDGDTVFASEGADEYSGGKDLSAIDLARFTIGPGRTRGIGTAAVPLILQCDRTSSGVFQNLCGGSGVVEYLRSANVTTEITTIINRPAPGNQLNVQSALVPSVVQETGSIYLGDTVNATNVRHVGGSGLYEASSNAMTLMEFFGGSATLKRSAATLLVGASGLLIDRLAAAFATLTDVWETLMIKKCGTHAAMILRPGAVLDLRTLEQPFTITALTSYPGSKILRARSNPIDITISGETRIGGGWEAAYA
jgi:hypothetical protein